MGHTVRQDFAWTILGPLVLLGVVLVDIMFDEGPAADAAMYYTHMRTLPGPLAAAIPAIVVVGFLPLIVRLRAMKALDLVTLLCCAPAVVIFVAALIPLEDQVAAGPEDPQELARLLSEIRTYHLVILPLTLLTVVVQILAHRQPVTNQRPE